MKFKPQAMIASSLTFSLLACSGPTTAEIELARTEIDGTLVAYVTSWLDLNKHFNATITGIGTWESELLTRLDTDQHHEIRCVAAKQYAFLSVRFSGPDWHRYQVDCRDGTAAPAPRVKTPLNLTEYFKNADGRVLEHAAVTPLRLAEPIVADGKDPPVVSASPFPPLYSTGSEVEQNIWLVCRETGEGTLYLRFAASSTPDNGEYRLVCREQHDQGGGG